MHPPEVNEPPLTAAEPFRIAIAPGTEVQHGENRFIIRSMLGFEAVVAENSATGEIERLPIAELYPARNDEELRPAEPAFNLVSLDERDWAEARRRLELISPLLDGVRCPRSVVEERARSCGVNATTLYRWTRLYRTSGLLSSLLPHKPSGGKGKSRLKPAVEAILEQTIQDFYLTRQQRTARSTALEVARRCREARLMPPDQDTVRLRIRALPMRERLARRSHRKEATDRYVARPGAFEAERPLDVVQIDHTVLDIMVVDRQDRLPIGRPWITLAIDVYSRMVVGFAISLDPPGATSTGICISNAALPKEAWLAERAIEGSWPCWGFPSRIHLDNAKEFHGEMLRRACEQYGIKLEYRPVAQPHNGGHIERLLGTLMRALHELPGATFSHPRQRGKYDSEAMAVMTIVELEHWLTEYIVNVYHTRKHSGIHTSPLQRWTTGVLNGAKGSQPITLSRPTNEDRIRLDFLPFVERTVQPTGVIIDGIQYFGDVLRRYVGATESGRKRRFIFRRDPRDISAVSFWDPDLEQYANIPYRNTTHPPISIWELRELQRKLREIGSENIDEGAIFATYERLRRHEAQAVKETKRARRARERRTTHVKRASGTAPEPDAVDKPEAGFVAADITPFDIEEF